MLIIGMLLTATLTATALFEWNPDEPLLWRDTPTMTLPDGPMFWRDSPTFTVSEPVATFDSDDVVTYRWPYIRLQKNCTFLAYGVIE